MRIKKCHSFHHYPQEMTGSDALQVLTVLPCNELLKRMKTDGYLVERTFENGDELASEILSEDNRSTLDDSEKMARRAEALQNLISISNGMHLFHPQFVTL